MSQTQITASTHMCMFLAFSLLMCADVPPCGEDVVSGRPDGAVLLYSDCLIPQSVSKTEISEIPV